MVLHHDIDFSGKLIENVSKVNLGRVESDGVDRKTCKNFEVYR